MGFFSRWFNRNRVYGQPFLDTNGRWRIRIFRLQGAYDSRDYLFTSSIEDTYPTREAAAEILKSVKRMEIKR